MAEAVATAAPPINRREFLFYVWTGSIALATAGSVGAVLWFAYPKFKVGEFGGTFEVSTEKLPKAGAGPDAYESGRFWLVNTDSGVLALYKVCVHLGCLYKWTPSNDRFECPCHGSKYQVDGTYIEGPAPRNLDRFVIDAVDSKGAVLASTKKGDANVDPGAGEPLALPDSVTTLRVNTGARVKGRNHS